MARPQRKCAACGGVCYWHDTAWVCRDCGSEWYPSGKADAKWEAPWTADDDERIFLLRAAAKNFEDAGLGLEAMNPDDREELRALRRREMAEVHRRRVAYFKKGDTK